MAGTTDFFRGLFQGADRAVGPAFAQAQRIAAARQQQLQQQQFRTGERKAGEAFSREAETRRTGRADRIRTEDLARGTKEKQQAIQRGDRQGFVAATESRYPGFSSSEIGQAIATGRLDPWAPGARNQIAAAIAQVKAANDLKESAAKKHDIAARAAGPAAGAAVRGRETRKTGAWEAKRNNLFRLNEKFKAKTGRDMTDAERPPAYKDVPMAEAIQPRPQPGGLSPEQKTQQKAVDRKLALQDSVIRGIVNKARRESYISSAELGAVMQQLAELYKKAGQPVPDDVTLDEEARGLVALDDSFIMSMEPPGDADAGVQ